MQWISETIDAPISGSLDAGLEAATAGDVKGEWAREDGKTKVTIDYALPDKMHQTVVAPGQPAPLETIAVSRWAWGNQGGGWEELQPQFAQSVTASVHTALAEPIELPKGSVIECTAHYDNSPNNKFNPDPAKEVRWGDQSWEEMMIGFFDVAFDAKTDYKASD